MRFTPYPFQRDGVRRIWDLTGRALVADEQGLGKTITAGMYIQENSTARPVICVVPAGLKLAWKKELWDKFRLTSVILNGRKPLVFPSYRKKDVVILNYEIIEPWMRFLKSLNAQIIVFDEGHYISGINSQRTQNATELAKGIMHCLILTGTPLVNRHWELYPLLAILDPEEFNSPMTFGYAYCEVTEERGKLQYSGSVNSAKLNKMLLKSYMIRRTKAEVLPDLPKKRQYVLPFDITGRAEYDYAESDLIGWLSSFDPARAERAARAIRFTKFSYLKKLAAVKKMPAVFAWIDDFLVSSDYKLTLGIIHHEITDMILKKYPGVPVIDGRRTQTQKEVAKNQFNNDPKTRLIVLQIKSGGVGLNLQGAKRSAAAIELPWAPGQVRQFTDRVHRIGTLDPVDVYLLVAAGTVEEKVCSILQRKSKILDMVLDGKKGTVDSANIFDLLQIELSKKQASKTLNRGKND